MKGHVYVSNPVDSQGYVKWSETENETWAHLVVVEWCQALKKQPLPWKWIRCLSRCKLNLDIT